MLRRWRTPPTTRLPRLLSPSAARRLRAPTQSQTMAGRAADATAPAEDIKLIFAPADGQTTGQAAQFTRGTLRRRDLDARSPIAQFAAWFAEAQAAAGAAGGGGGGGSGGGAAAPPVETCTLATAGLPDGCVSARCVYLKELDAGGGFVVYSNLGSSRKARDLASNSHAALVFYWAALQRQVRVEGRAAPCAPARSQRYFDARPRASRIGAWASRQSQVLEPRCRDDADDDGRAQLDCWVAEAEDRFRGQDHIPVPDFWGGLRIVPSSIEFWQGRDSRLHDRFLYERLDDGDGDGDGRWKLSRLSP